MQPDALGTFPILEVAAHGIGDHRIQFGEGVALRGDAAAARSVPARDVAAGSRARFYLENDFFHRAHAGKLIVMPRKSNFSFRAAVDETMNRIFEN